MTNEQKHLIECLRAAGQGYTAVAKAVGLPKETVKSFCRRYSVFGNHTQAVVKEKKATVLNAEKRSNGKKKQSREDILDVIRESVDVIDIIKPIYNFKAG